MIVQVSIDSFFFAHRLSLTFSLLSTLLSVVQHRIHSVWDLSPTLTLTPLSLALALLPHKNDWDWKTKLTDQSGSCKVRI